MVLARLINRPRASSHGWQEQPQTTTRHGLRRRRGMSSAPRTDQERCNRCRCGQSSVWAPQPSCTLGPNGSTCPIVCQPFFFSPLYMLLPPPSCQSLVVFVFVDVNLGRSRFTPNSSNGILDPPRYKVNLDSSWLPAHTPPEPARNRALDEGPQQAQLHHHCAN